jgi:anti-sigma regulatory factor (Ser/Thr protein kinase)
MGESIKLEFEVDGDNFESAGAASEEVKRSLKQLGIEPGTIRRVAIAMYEGEINMVIHAHGGKAVVDI